MKNLVVETLVTVAIVVAFSSPVHAKKGDRTRPVATQAVPLKVSASLPQASTTVHAGAFEVEAGGVIYSCHNYCAGITSSTADSLY